VVVSVGEKASFSRQVTIKETNENEPSDEVSKAKVGDVKTGFFSVRPGRAAEATCFLPQRRPAWRRRELGRGSCMERGNLHLDAKGEFQIADL